MSSAPLRSSPQPQVPFLLAPRSRDRLRSPLVIWHLLSLDAPSVAVCWTAFIAWSAGLHLPWTDGAAMFVAVWVLYAADRLLDARPLFTEPSAPQLEARHRFHHRHRRRFLQAIAAAALPLLFLLHATANAVLHLYVLLASLLGVWLLLIHARPVPSAAAHRLPKELAVGLFFPAAVFIPTVARVPGMRSSLLPLAVLFGCLCTLNCLFLYSWEHPQDAREAHRSTTWAVHHLKALALTFTLLTDGLFLAGRTTLPAALSPILRQVPHFAAVSLALSLSGAALLMLHAVRRELRPVTLRALADLVLLSPLPLLAILKVPR